MKPNTGNKRAQERFPIAGASCEECDRPAILRHHRDGDPLNNEPANVALLCGRCHKRHHPSRWTVEQLRTANAVASANRLARTRCAQGHPFTPENTIATARQRACRICRAAANRAYRARLR